MGCGFVAGVSKVPEKEAFACSLHFVIGDLTG
jgi:hypothetical protein